MARRRRAWRHCRARFSLCGHEYCLAGADPSFEFHCLVQDDSNAAGEALLCVSLGEVYHGYAYKVAATIVTPPPLRSTAASKPTRRHMSADRLHNQAGGAGGDRLKDTAMKVFTIGFTKTSAQSFFERLQRVGVQRVLDVRLNNVSQLAGFAKRDDLRYFLKAIGGIDYEHQPELAPTQEMLDAYKKQKGAWPDYEKRFLELMAQRRIEQTLPREALANACLLCSEDKPHHCHRRLVVEYLQEAWGDLEIAHL